MQALIGFLGIKDLIPYGACLSWTPLLLWLNVISDLLITLAYYSIPAMLIYFIRQRKDAPYARLIVLFAGFSVACGTTHLLSAITIWVPLYWLDAGLKALSAAISVGLALLLLRVIPRMLAATSAAQLQSEIQQRIKAEEALRATNAALHQQIARNRLLLDSALDGIISMDRNGDIIGWDGQAEDMFGYTREQALGRKMVELIVPSAYRDRHKHGFARFLAGHEAHIIGTRVEVAGLRADGSEFPIELAIGVLERENEPSFSAYVSDISQRRQAEAARQEAQDKLQKIAGQLPGVVYQFCLRPDGSCSLPYVSDVLRDIYRIDPADVRDDASKIFTKVHPDDLEQHLASIQASARDLSPWRNEYRLKFDDGSERWLFGNALPQREEDGSVLWHGVVSDISERKTIEKAARESEKKLSTILDNVDSFIYIKDSNYRYRYVNKAVLEVLGRSMEDMIGKTDEDFFGPDVVARLREQDIRVLELGERMVSENAYAQKDGVSRRTHLSVKQPLRREDGGIYGLCGVSTDITERKAFEEKLRDSEAFNVSILNSLTSHIAVLDERGVIVAVNNAWRCFAQENGVTESHQDMLGANYLDVCLDAQKRPNGAEAYDVQAGIRAVLAGKLESFHLEYPCHSQTEQRWFYMHVSPLQGSHRGVVVSHTNITERKIAEEKVRAASQYARSLIEASLDPLVTISAEGKITDVNTATEHVTGIGRDDLIGSDFADYFTEPERAREGYQLVFFQGFVTDYPLAIRHTSGKIIHVLYNASLYRDVNGNVIGVFAAARDITVQREREQQLGLFHSLFELTSDCVFMASPKQDFRFVFVNEATCRHFGVEREQLLTWRLPDWDDNFKTQAQLDALWQEIKDKKGFLIETTHRVADGRKIPVEVSTNYLEYGGEEYAAGYFLDITERKQIEAELVRSNTELEQFAYAVSHDMRQPLRMVSSYLSLIESALDEKLDEETRQCLNFAVDGAKRMDTMILSLLDYSRIGRKFEEIARINSKDSLDEALAFLGPELSASGGSIDVTGEWPELFASRDELTRLLQNLIGNALKYHDEGQPPQVHVHAELRSGRLRVEVRDRGIGIDPRQMDRLFKVFSRLQARSRFDGSGVGLALCRKIVEHHAGEIGVESAGEGLGCTFWFELPIAGSNHAD
ncbi:MAG: PAS domain S-box protein [Methylobacter sp.]